MTPIYFHGIIVNVITASVTLSIADNLFFFLTVGKHCPLTLYVHLTHPIAITDPLPSPGITAITGPLPFPGITHCNQ